MYKSGSRFYYKDFILGLVKRNLVNFIRKKINVIYKVKKVTRQVYSVSGTPEENNGIHCILEGRFTVGKRTHEIKRGIVYR